MILVKLNNIQIQVEEQVKEGSSSKEAHIRIKVVMKVHTWELAVLKKI